MSHRSLRKQVALVLSTVALPCFILVIVVAAIRNYQAVKEDYANSMRARIGVVRSLIADTVLNQESQVLNLVDRVVWLMPQEKLAVIARDLHLHRPGNTWYVVDGRGRVLLAADPFSEYVDLDFSCMGIPGNGQKVLHRQSLLTKRSMVSVQYQLGEEMQLVVEIDLANIIPNMAHFTENQLFIGEHFFVLSPSGKVIYHPDRTLVRTRANLKFAMKNISKPDANGLFTFLYQEEKYIALSEPFTVPTGWTMYYSLPWRVMFDKAARVVVGQVGLLILLFSLLFLLLVQILNYFFSKPVSRIVAALHSSDKSGEFEISPDMTGGVMELETILLAIKNRDEAIDRSFKQFQAVLDSLESIVYVADMQNHTLLFINRYARERVGDVLGQKCYRSFQTGQNVPCSFCTNDRLLDEDGNPTGVHVWEFQNVGVEQWYEYRDQAITWIDGKIVRMTIATDITDRKNAEAELLQEKEQLAVTLRSIGDAVITTDVDAGIVLLNKVAEQLTGWSQEEARGRDLTEVFHIINEKSRKICESPVERVLEYGETISLANHTLLISRDGTERSIADSGAPIRDRESQVIGVVLVFRDVTEIHKSEKELLKIRKLESVGVLAGGIAHDFNNILTVILGNLNLAEYYLDSHEKAYSLIKNADKACLRARDLALQLLTFSRGGEPVRELTSLAKLIRESADFVLHGSNIVCKYNIPEDLWSAEVDAGQMSQVIQNLVINGCHAMPNGGVVEISCVNRSLEEVAKIPFRGSGNYVEIKVTDYGAGIPDEIIDQVFDPYFTTKEEGSGLGLAIVHSIISKHGAHIGVESAIGKGTTFTILLPASIKHIEEEMLAVQTASGSGTVMVMDDDAMILEVAQQMLEYLGYEVLIAGDGVAAISLFKERQEAGNPVDLVIMDLTIPGGMGGWEAIQELQALYPEVKAIVASGYSNDPVMAEYEKYGFVGSLHKPFELAELSRKVRSVLAN